MQYTEICFFSEEKIENFIDFFNIFAQNMHCGYTLEPPHKNKKSRYTLQIPVFFFFCIKLVLKGVYISRTCFPDAFCYSLLLCEVACNQSLP